MNMSRTCLNTDNVFLASVYSFLFTGSIYAQKLYFILKLEVQWSAQ